MVICLDGFENLHSGVKTEIWKKGNAYVVTDKKRNVLDTVSLELMPKSDLVRILISEYGDDADNVNRLKRIIGEPVPRKASGKA